MEIIENWPNEIIRPEDGEAVYDILRAIQGELDYIDSETDTLRDERFIDTASGQELEKLASEVGIVQQTGESEEHFRERAMVAKSLSRSDGTLPDIADVLYSLFGEDAQNISVTTGVGSPSGVIEIPDALFDDIEMSDAELELMLEDAVPTGDTLTVVVGETLKLGETGGRGLGEGKLV